MKNILLVLLALALIGFWAYPRIIGESEILGGSAATAVDVVGTRVGTSTTPFYFTSTSTNFYPSLITKQVDEVIYTLEGFAASSNASVLINVYGSNDEQCNTATTSSSMNHIVTSDINWHDAGTALKGLAGSTSLGAATTTISWYPGATSKVGRQIILTNLNHRCLGLRVSASNIALWAQILKKVNN